MRTGAAMTRIYGRNICPSHGKELSILVTCMNMETVRRGNTHGASFAVDEVSTTLVDS